MPMKVADVSNPFKSFTEEQLQQALASANGYDRGLIEYELKKKVDARKEAEAAGKEKAEGVAMATERASIVESLRNVEKGFGTAAKTVNQQTMAGNNRIRALSATGRGGLNSGVNAANAIGISTAAGTQQARAAAEAEKSQARAALGQVIAGGQDADYGAARTTLEALRDTPAAKDPTQDIAVAGGLAQGLWAGTQNTAENEQKKKNAASQRGRWGV